MPFAVDPFAAAIARSLHSKGFVRTSATILEKIGIGYLNEEAEGGSPASRPYSPFEQRQVCADVIEQNVILPYAAWEACTLQLRGEELLPETWREERELEELLLVTAAAGGSRQLGSFSYRKPIEKLRATIDRLRGMEPPAPEGGPPPSSPRGGGGIGVSTVRAAYPGAVGGPISRSGAVGTWSEEVGYETGYLVERSFEERLPFSKVVPVLSARKRIVDAHISEGAKIRLKKEDDNGFTS
ncbi:hypothetical protein GFM11_27520 [Rhizobium leguminosarum bv. viciae]|uniref:hypothetical protein n=1 Tax=Rhizobium leguminosarum TaxID=384 RepID=UPI001441D7F6|nr:hypothetical protein [Rhizobium leguminosarum]NKK16970.1 hypothetical protein [Rhizobium leguminosarum bv. viciae]